MSGSHLAEQVIPQSTGLSVVRDIKPRAAIVEAESKPMETDSPPTEPEIRSVQPMNLNLVLSELWNFGLDASCEGLALAAALLPRPIGRRLLKPLLRRINIAAAFSR